MNEKVNFYRLVRGTELLGERVEVPRHGDGLQTVGSDLGGIAVRSGVPWLRRS